MTYFYYNTRTWNTGVQQQPRIPEEIINEWKHLTKKSNWRIVELPSGYFQTEFKKENEEQWADITRRETLGGAERAIDSSIEHYNKKLKAIEGPKVVKTFEKEEKNE
tara:strand:- start:223 stop:543 length:321 start_codon:yes stop_codon:yes gene_type:complete